MVINMQIFNSVSELIGSTPFLKLNKIMSKYSLKADILAKLELFNPAGSAKDRVGFYMILEAEKRGVIKPGDTIIEPTSGNTGVGLAMSAAALGYKVILTMPDTMSVERRNLLAAYGAELVLTEGAKGMEGAVLKAQELNREIQGSVILGQFDNPANPYAHFISTGPEIWNDTDGKADIFVAGIGTGGTLSGVGRYLKNKNPDVKIVGVEPFESPLISEGKAGKHGIQGIGANFVPENLDKTVYDEIIEIKSQDAMQMAKELVRTEGVLTGISSGAALKAAVELAKRSENEGKTIVVLLPDTGERYLSTGIYND